MRPPTLLRYPYVIPNRRPFYRRPAVWTALLLGAMCALAWAWRPLLRVRREFAMERARRAANDPKRFNVRLSRDEESLAAKIAEWWPEQTPLQAASDLSEVADTATGDEARRLSGIMHFLAGEYGKASSAFSALGQRDANDSNDLAAAELALAQQTGREEHVLRALAAADGALGLDRTSSEARFNRAVAMERIGALPAAAAQWRQYRDDSAWEVVAKQRRDPPLPDRVVWARLDLGCLSSDEIRQLAARYPQLARLTAESIFLSSWADAMNGNEREAAHQLRLARAAAEVLQTRGDSLVNDAVRAIDDAAGTPRLQHLVAGHRAYRDGRLALRSHDLVAAEHHLQRAQKQLTAGGSPMAALAANYMVTAIANRPADALELLERLRRAAPPGHRAHLGRIHHEIANVQGALGHWSEAIAAAQQSIAIFSSLAERGHVAAAEVTLSELYDFVGKPELAWKHGTRAVRAACVAGEYDRARVGMASLTRTEMRGRRWEQARSLAALEKELIPLHDDVRLNAGVFLRVAAIEQHLGRPNDARRAVVDARAAANKLPPGSTKEKLLADINGAAGAIERSKDPGRAIPILSSAIRFQHAADRPIVLPELYLERGRAQMAVGNLDTAAHDFEQGIRELERQRNRVREAELRPGIFDDAFELFDEAVSLRVRRGEGADAILKDVERGRARAVLEQVQAKNPALVRPSGVEEVQRHLTAGMALVEYVVLPDRLVIVVIRSDRAAVRTASITRALLGNAAADFLRDVESQPAGARLHDLLIRPILADLHGVNAITFVVPDVLQRVPFAALRAKGGPFLVERFAPAMAPGAGVFVATLRRARQLSGSTPATIAVFANPTIPRDKFPLLPSLHTSEYEARAVANYYAKHEIFTRDAATAEVFIERAPSYGFIHYAGHATVDRHEPAASALVCASTVEVHGALTSRQIAQMQFRVTRAVVLAACSTMDGRNAAVEGVPSLARAFLIAGVPAVVGTLWDVEDSEAAAVVRPLHEQLASGREPAQALRMAQVRAIRAGLSVRQWAAFALTGAAQ